MPRSYGNDRETSPRKHRANARANRAFRANVRLSLDPWAEPGERLAARKAASEYDGRGGYDPDAILSRSFAMNDGSCDFTLPTVAAERGRRADGAAVRAAMPLAGENMVDTCGARRFLRACVDADCTQAVHIIATEFSPDNRDLEMHELLDTAKEMDARRLAAERAATAPAGNQRESARTVDDVKWEDRLGELESSGLPKKLADAIRSYESLDVYMPPLITDDNRTMERLYKQMHEASETVKRYCDSGIGVSFIEETSPSANLREIAANSMPRRIEAAESHGQEKPEPAYTDTEILSDPAMEGAQVPGRPELNGMGHAREMLVKARACIDIAMSAIWDDDEVFDEKAAEFRQEMGL